jgi:hypothetical protein
LRALAIAIAAAIAAGAAFAAKKNFAAGVAAAVAQAPSVAEAADPAFAEAEALLLDEARLKAAYAECLSKIDRPAEGVVVPVESHPDGTIKVDAKAAKAQFFDKEGLVWCGDVTVREFDEKGRLKMELEAASCIVDRKTKSGWLDGVAVGRYGATELSGRGIYFSCPQEFVKITSEVSIVSSDIKFEGVRL